MVFRLIDQDVYMSDLGTKTPGDTWKNNVTTDSTSLAFSLQTFGLDDHCTLG